MSKRALWAVVCLVLGCGARTPLELEEGEPKLQEKQPDAAAGRPIQSPGGKPIDSYDAGEQEQACTLCRGDAQCRKCKIAGSMPTYRCDPATPLPAPSCWTIGELYTYEGKLYRCVYCD